MDKRNEAISFLLSIFFELFEHFIASSFWFLSNNERLDFDQKFSTKKYLVKNSEKIKKTKCEFVEKFTPFIFLHIFSFKNF
jgi:hypothetical protein